MTLENKLLDKIAAAQEKYLEQVASSDQAQLYDLYFQLPRVAELLGEQPEDLMIIEYSEWPNEYMRSEFRDRLVGKYGPFEGMPTVQYRRQQAKTLIGLGVFVYEPQNRPDLRYVLHTVKGQYGNETFLIASNKNIFRLKRMALRLNKQASMKVTAPILPDGVLEEVVQNTVGFLLKAKKIEKYGVTIKRGLILDGPPGNGKTMLCKYLRKLCSRNGIRWGVVTSAEIDDAYKNKALGELFSSYSVTFFDDIDVGYMDRSKGNGKMACSLLTAMDGVSDQRHLVRIFTTNEPVSELDAAFTRPGRIDKCITINKPTAALRQKLVETIWPKEIREAIDIESLIERSDDYSFAELEAIRTFLVTHFVLDDGKWDLNRAFEEFESRRAEKHRKGGKKLGFAEPPAT